MIFTSFLQEKKRLEEKLRDLTERVNRGVGESELLEGELASKNKHIHTLSREVDKAREETMKWKGGDITEIFFGYT